MTRNGFSLSVVLCLACMLILIEVAVAAPKTQEQASPLQPVVGYSIHNDTSPPLAELALRPVPPRNPNVHEVPLFRTKSPGIQELLAEPQGAICEQEIRTPLPLGTMPPPIVNFDGIDGALNSPYMVPPDPNGDVGPNHYVQVVNTLVAVYDKSGVPLLAPVDYSTIWSGFSGIVCREFSQGDPIVLYDEKADRWMLSNLGYVPDSCGLPTPPYYQCIAVSQTPDPLGAWYRYDFAVHDRKFNDYPKFGVWPVDYGDGAPQGAYFMSANQFTFEYDPHEPCLVPVFHGVGAFAFNREPMLKGDPASFVYFDLELRPGTQDIFGLLPTDLDGAWPPPAGSPNYFVNHGYKWDTGHVLICYFTPDFRMFPGNSTFTGPILLDVDPYDPAVCDPNFNGYYCIPQKGDSTPLDALDKNFSMYRAAYRNFGTHESIVFNHTVDVGDLPMNWRAGIRWYEIRDPRNSPTVHQQGTYTLPDGLHRWVGSIAMDQKGDMALGFSVSSGAIFPSIRYVGRLAGDPLGEMAQAEAELQQGTGAQTLYPRWGDYTMMAVDPSDGCTFWYTNEYYFKTGSAWRTRIGAFRFEDCLGPVINDGPKIFDGCDPLSADGRVDVEELITLIVPLHSRNTTPIFNVEGTLSTPDPLVDIGGFSPEVQQCGAHGTQTSVYGDIPPDPGRAFGRFQFRVRQGHSLSGDIPFKLDLRNDQGPLEPILFTVPMSPTARVMNFRNPTPPDPGPLYMVDWEDPVYCGPDPNDRGYLFYWEPTHCEFPNCNLTCDYDPDTWNLYRGYFDIRQQYGIQTHVAKPPEIGACHTPCNMGRWDTSPWGSTKCQFLDCYSDDDQVHYYFVLSGETDCPGAATGGAEGPVGFTFTFPNSWTEIPYGGGTCHDP